jgi:hypothetical protein
VPGEDLGAQHIQGLVPDQQQRVELGHDLRQRAPANADVGRDVPCRAQDAQQADRRRALRRDRHAPYLRQRHTAEELHGVDRPERADRDSRKENEPLGVASEGDGRRQRHVDLAGDQQSIQGRRVPLDHGRAHASCRQLQLKVVVERKAVDELDPAHAHRRQGILTRHRNGRRRCRACRAPPGRGRRRG